MAYVLALVFDLHFKQPQKWLGHEWTMFHSNIVRANVVSNDKKVMFGLLNSCQPKIIS